MSDGRPIVTVAELEELKANPEAEASGTVIESRLDPGRGPVVSLLVDRGTLRIGDAVVAGANWGRVRAMHDYRGQALKEATPGMPVELTIDLVEGSSTVATTKTAFAVHDARELAFELLAAALERGPVRLAISLGVLWAAVGVNLRGIALYERLVVPLMFLTFVLGGIVIVAGFAFDHADFAAVVLAREGQALPTGAAPVLGGIGAFAATVTLLLCAYSVS